MSSLSIDIKHRNFTEQKQHERMPISEENRWTALLSFFFVSVMNLTSRRPFKLNKACNFICISHHQLAVFLYRYSSGSEEHFKKSF